MLNGFPPAGLGRRTKIFRSSTGEQFAQKESLKCLGAKVSTSRSGRDHFDSSRFEAAATTARNLRHVPIPRQQKTLIVQSAILPAALARILFAPPTTEAVEKLATALTLAVWGPKNPKRSSEVVLGVLEKAHLTHPATATAYRITADFYSACGRLPHLMPLMTEVRRLYGERVTAALGPVGTAVRHGLQPCGHTWNGGPPSSVNLDGAALRPLAMSASSRNHIIRDNLRNRLWKRLETRRPSFSGITNIAIESTNALWTTRHCPPQNALLIRVALAGGVNTAEYTSRFRQGGSPACTLCDSGALEDEHHVYWDCTAFENIRTKPEYAGIAQSDRRLWPSCLREHGIVTPATREFAGPVQALMAEILAERARRISVRWLERKAATPWERCAQMPTAKREFPFRRIAPAWAWLRYWDEGTFLAAIDWLSGLEWSSDGDMAAVEAAIDFELFSGLDIKAPSKAAKTHREKANGMRCMLSAINKLAVQQQLGKCLPGDFKSKTTALSFIGLSSVPGFQPRPRHRMPETGPTIMQQVKTGYGTAPAYPPERTDRARRWVIPRAPLANPDPLHLPHAVPEATKNAPKRESEARCQSDASGELGTLRMPLDRPDLSLAGFYARCAEYVRVKGTLLELPLDHHQRKAAAAPVSCSPAPMYHPATSTPVKLILSRAAAGARLAGRGFLLPAPCVGRHGSSAAVASCRTPCVVLPKEAGGAPSQTDRGERQRESRAYSGSPSAPKVHTSGPPEELEWDRGDVRCPARTQRNPAEHPAAVPPRSDDGFEANLFVGSGASGRGQGDHGTPAGGCRGGQPGSELAQSSVSVSSRLQDDRIRGDGENGNLPEAIPSPHCAGNDAFVHVESAPRCAPVVPSRVLNEPYDDLGRRRPQSGAAGAGPDGFPSLMGGGRLLSRTLPPRLSSSRPVRGGKHTRTFELRAAGSRDWLAAQLSPAPAPWLCCGHAAPFDHTAATRTPCNRRFYHSVASNTVSYVETLPAGRIVPRPVTPWQRSLLRSACSAHRSARARATA
ncbi:hypothetical protein DIPPA_19977 [Diplonema papillatum]|nr:hypothetical protein DIPPA_19977 [Diplonema papillatum]